MKEELTWKVYGLKVVFSNGCTCNFVNRSSYMAWLRMNQR